jgi:hypothetical protein
MNGDYEPLGHNWVSSFLQRNPRVHSVVGRSIEASRAEAASLELIRTFLELVEATRLRLGIQLHDIYNMDETEIAIGVCNNTRVLTSTHKRKAYVKSSENREWITVVECVSARDVNNQSGLIGLIDSNQSAHSIKPISRLFCINQANLKIFVDRLLS